MKTESTKLLSATPLKAVKVIARMEPIIPEVFIFNIP
jgi:hypothetical protein